MTPTVLDYNAAFAKERANTYPMVDAFVGAFDLDRDRLESAARVLACPLKKSPPNWQHGRVLYAAAAWYLAASPGGFFNFLDIGTAKGFSALCLQSALNDADARGRVTSVDVIDPNARVPRKTAAEVDGLLTLAETLAPWPIAAQIQFVQSTGIDWLKAHPDRIHIAFVDGAHDAVVVEQEGRLLAERQEPGDHAIFDDVHRPDLLKAVESLRDAYRFDVMKVLPTRHYAIGVRL